MQLWEWWPDGQCEDKEGDAWDDQIDRGSVEGKVEGHGWEDYHWWWKEVVLIESQWIAEGRVKYERGNGNVINRYIN